MKKMLLPLILLLLTIILVVSCGNELVTTLRRHRKQFPQTKSFIWLPAHILQLSKSRKT